MKLKKLLILTCTFILFFSSISIVFADDEIEELDFSFVYDEIPANASETKVLSRSAVIFDRESKTVIWGKKEDLVVPMASTTKIMTAIVVLEKANLKDVVNISKKAGGTGGSTAGLTANDKVSVNDLLYGLMLPSRK